MVNGAERGIAQTDSSAESPHGQKLAGGASNGEWNDVGEAASTAAAGNLYRSGMVWATTDPWNCAASCFHPRAFNQQNISGASSPPVISLNKSSSFTLRRLRGRLTSDR